MGKRNLKLTIEYVGTSYCGWQKQPGVPTIQEEIEKAFFNITQMPLKIIGAGRTDSGVHAKGQVAHCLLPENITIPTPKILPALNAHLPLDIRIKDCSLEQEKFHARFSSISKNYLYTIRTHPIRSPFSDKYEYHFPYALNTNSIKKSACLLMGSHDFFSLSNSGRTYKSTIRILYDINLSVTSENLIFSIKGNGFLYKMVRNLIGLLLEVGRKKRSPESVLEVLQAKDRTISGPSLPAKGLCLFEVNYNKDTISSNEEN